MEQSSSFSFSRVWGVALSAALLLMAAFAYHKLLQSSVEAHHEQIRQAVREHCRYMTGKQIHQLSQDDYSDKFQACDNFTVKSTKVAGGLYDPVIVKITLERSADFPLDEDVFIFKSAAMNFHFLSGLSALMSGQWEFNFYNTYSVLTFNGSL